MNLQALPLTSDNFAAFGQVIDLEQIQQRSINNGLTTRFHDLLDIDATQQGGRAIVNVFRTSPLPLPHRITIMERHPLGSQAFLPMAEKPFLVLVGDSKNALGAGDLHLFITNGRQGINLFKNTWHHFQIVLDHTQDFIVLDRGGQGRNLEEIEITDEVWIQKAF